MRLESLIITYGYPVLFVGVLLEGEAFLILAAYLAHRGYFSLPLVITLAALASFSMAQLLFHLGDRYSHTLLTKRPAWQQRMARVDALLNRYGNGLVVSFRALFGLRTVIPVAIGATAYPVGRFTLLNGVGAILWAVIIALAGNWIAQMLEVVVTDLRQHELLVVAILAAGGLVLGLHHLCRQPKIQP